MLQWANHYCCYFKFSNPGIRTHYQSTSYHFSSGMVTPVVTLICVQVRDLPVVERPVDWTKFNRSRSKSALSPFLMLFLTLSHQSSVGGWIFYPICNHWACYAPGSTISQPFLSHSDHKYKCTWLRTLHCWKKFKKVLLKAWSETTTIWSLDKCSTALL